MALFRVLLVVFNVAIVTFLIFEMLRVGREERSRTRKITVIVGGCILLFAPFGMFLHFFAPAFQYFFVYPIAIALFIYLTRRM